MSPLPLADRTVTEVAALLRAREVSSRELTEACLARIERDAERLNTFLAVEPEAAASAADAADAALDRGDGTERPLLGIPYALKDIFVTRALDDDGQPLPGGLPTTAGSRMLEGYRSPYASSAQERLDAAGAVLLGKTNCDEFAMGSSTENSGLRADPQPVGRDDRPGRVIGRFLGGGGWRPGLFRARNRYRRVDPAARLSDRHGRHEADLRTREPLRDGRLRVEPRPMRPVRPIGARRGPRSRGRWRGTTRATRRASRRARPGLLPRR